MGVSIGQVIDKTWTAESLLGINFLKFASHTPLLDKLTRVHAINQAIIQSKDWFDVKNIMCQN